LSKSDSISESQIIEENEDTQKQELKDSFQYAISSNAANDYDEVASSSHSSLHHSMISSTETSSKKDNLFKSKAEDFWNSRLDKCLLKWSRLLYNDWKKISKKFFKELDLRVTPFFLKNRFSSLEGEKSPSKELKLDHEIDLMIVKSVHELGLKWNLIAEELDFYDAVKLKNRFYNHIKRKGRYEELKQELGL